MASWSHKARTALLIVVGVVSTAVVGTLAADALGATPATPYQFAGVPAP